MLAGGDASTCHDFDRPDLERFVEGIAVEKNALDMQEKLGNLLIWWEQSCSASVEKADPQKFQPISKLLKIPQSRGFAARIIFEAYPKTKFLLPNLKNAYRSQISYENHNIEIARKDGMMDPPDGHRVSSSMKCVILVLEGRISKGACPYPSAGPTDNTP